jgi:DNA-binding GntR family transcriptional regulator
MEAIINRNAELAAYNMEQHIENACKGVIEIMNTQE